MVLMDNTLLLHIGTPKTGTSSIQRALYSNGTGLLRCGWIYPDMKAELSEIRDYASNPEKNGNVFFQGMSAYERCSKEWKRACESLIRFLEIGNVILSAEEFYEYDTESVIGAIAEFCPKIDVAVYLRRQDLYVESRWNQIVKDDRCYKGTFEQYIRDSETWGEGHYLRKLEGIAQIVGEENLIIRAFEREQLQNGDVVTDFFHMIGFDDYRANEQERTINDALEGQLIEVKRAINQIYDVEKYGTSRLWSDVLKRVYRRFPASVKFGKHYFTPEERLRYLEKFDEENKEIACRFLKRNDRRLFYNMDIKLRQTDYKISEVMQMAIQELMREALKRR